MKSIFIFCLFVSVPAYACIDLSGLFEKPIQNDKDYLYLNALKQDGCARVDIYSAAIYLPSGLYMENPNPSSYLTDDQQHCNSFGFCYSAKINRDKMDISHSPQDFSKPDGELCVSEAVSFSLDRTKSLNVTRSCNDGSVIEAVYKRH